MIKSNIAVDKREGQATRDWSPRGITARHYPVLLCLLAASALQVGCQENKPTVTTSQNSSEVTEPQQRPTQSQRTSHSFDYTTGWLAPLVDISADDRGVSRIDLSLEVEDLESQSATLTIFYGTPDYNPYGDADDTGLRTRRIEAKLIKQDPSESPQNPLAMLIHSSNANSDDRVIFSCLFNDSNPTRLRFVLSSQPWRHRLLLLQTDKYLHPDRILPLRSAKDALEVDRLPLLDEQNMHLRSMTFVTADNAFNLIDLFAEGSDRKLIHDRNHPSFNAYGDTVGSTLMGSVRQFVELEMMEAKDPSGENRRFYTASWRSLKPLQATLVLHLRIAGEHKLLLKDDGRIVYIIPLHSAKLSSWLQLKSRISTLGHVERQVFEDVCKKIPYYASFRLDARDIVSARFNSLTEENELVLKDIWRLPHLRTLEISGYELAGEYLAGLRQIESLRFSGGKVRASTLSQIGELNQLTSLSFYTSDVDCRGLKHLAALTQLQHFNFFKRDPGSFADHFDAEHLKALREFKNLETLSLHAMPLPEKAFDFLPVTEKLKSVQLGDDASFAGALRYAERNPQAEFRFGSSVSINLRQGNVSMPYASTDIDLEPVGRTKDIRSLRISNAENITDAGLAHLAGTRLLELEVLHAEKITDDGIDHISKISTLEKLTLSYCEQLTGASIDHLRRLTNLKKISAFQAGINPRILQSMLPNCEVSP